MSSKGKKAVALLRDLKRAGWLPPYDERTVREVLEEYCECEKVVQALIKEKEEAMEAEEEDHLDDLAAGMMVYTQTIDRNKRCVLVYLYHRLKKIRSLRWSHGRELPSEGGIAEKLHESEVAYFHRYNESLDKYMRQYIPTAREPLDLIQGQKIPEDLCVYIKVVDSGLGELMTEESGTVRFDKGERILVQRSDVEMLIRAGKVEQIPWAAHS